MSKKNLPRFPWLAGRQSFQQVQGCLENPNFFFDWWRGERKEKLVLTILLVAMDSGCSTVCYCSLHSALDIQRCIQSVGDRIESARRIALYSGRWRPRLFVSVRRYELVHFILYSKITWVQEDDSTYHLITFPANSAYQKLYTDTFSPCHLSTTTLSLDKSLGRYQSFILRRLIIATCTLLSNCCTGELRDSWAR